MSNLLFLTLILQKNEPNLIEHLERLKICSHVIVALRDFDCIFLNGTKYSEHKSSFKRNIS